MSRIKLLRQTLIEDGVDAFLVSDPANLIYLTGYTGSNGMLIVKKSQPKPIFYTDFRYQEQIKEEVKGCNTVIWDRNLYTDFPIQELKGVKSLGFESSSLSYTNYSYIKKQLRLKARLVPTSGIIENLRTVKEKSEIEKIRKAVSITDNVFLNILEQIKPGVSEKELASEIDIQFMRQGSIAFPTIVAFAERGALPHAKPTSKRLKKGDVIIFDIGVKFENYCSDMTRTVVLGKASSKVKNIYNIVLTAQRLALENIRAGEPASKIDAFSRNYIQEKGYGKYFGHSLGHGVGLMVHESPTLSTKSKEILKTNQVTSVEPGIYLPGEFGVRIEDLVVIKSTGGEVLTKSPKELIEI